MPKILSRAQWVMAAVTAALIAAAAWSALDTSRLMRLAEKPVLAPMVADLSALASDVMHAREALLQGAGPAAFDAVKRRLDARGIDDVEPTPADPDVQAARATLGDAALGFRLEALDLADPAARARFDARLRDMAMSLDILVVSTSRDLGAAAAAAIGASGAAMRRLMLLLSATGICGTALLASALWRARTLHRLARRDALTGLQNRVTFAETLDAVLRDPGPGNEVALMLLDVDLFKEINDTLGHAAGDLLLRGLAERFGALAGPGVHISRLGGDEFAVLLTAHQAHRAAGDMVARIGRLTGRPLDLGGKPVSVGMSIGVALTPLHWCDAETLLKNADIALYAAKAAGRGTFRFFSPKMDREFRDRRQMEEDLRLAVAEGGLEVHFQPLVELGSGAIMSCEALARWNRPRHGYVSPMAFIALAEEVGLISEIGDWVLRQACAAARTWPDHVRVSINLSPHQFDREGFVPAIAAILAETGLAPGRLELEITETLLLRDSEHVIGALAELRAMGIQIALDDFGTGYSSLSYLQRFAIDRIKIDQSFVRNMTRSPEATAIVEAICRLAAKLGVSTTGEGIETEEHAALLRGFGCVEGQGYLFDRPMPLAACTARFAERDRLVNAA